MKVAAMLANLTSRGVRLEVHGPQLIVDGPAEVLSDDLLQTLRSVKVELLTLLGGSVDQDGWEPADWQAYFEERAAIRQYDGKLAREDAGRQALEDALTHWLRLHPSEATDPRNGCVHCGRTDRIGSSLLPVLASGGHVWVHDQCWDSWRTARRQHAREALARSGVARPAHGCSDAP